MLSCRTPGRLLAATESPNARKSFEKDKLGGTEGSEREEAERPGGACTTSCPFITEGRMPVGDVCVLSRALGPKVRHQMPNPPPPPPPRPSSSLPHRQTTSRVGHITNGQDKLKRSLEPASAGIGNGGDVAHGVPAKRACVDAPTARPASNGAPPPPPSSRLQVPLSTVAWVVNDDREDGEIPEEEEAADRPLPPPPPPPAAPLSSRGRPPDAYNAPPPPPPMSRLGMKRQWMAPASRGQLQGRPPPPPPSTATRTALPPAPPSRKSHPPPPPPSHRASANLRQTPPPPKARPAPQPHRPTNEFGSVLSADVVVRPPPGLPLPRNYGTSLLDYKHMVVIGRGTYGEVSRAVHKDTGDLVAIKKMTIALPGEMHHQDGMAITTLRELRALQELSHVNIVKLREVVTEAKDRVPDHLYLVMDYAEMDLAGIVKQCRLTRRHIRFYMYQILEGLAYIQKHHLLHRDLKSANVLVTKKNVVKLADWGLCKFQREGSQARLTNPVVTLWYRAPELLLGTQHYDGGVDIWSCGMIMAEMLIGKPFLDGRDEMDQLHKIFDVCGAPESLVGYRGPKLPNKPSRIAEELRKRGVQDDEDAIKMVAQLCAPDPAKRPSANDACDIDFLWTRDPGHEDEVFPNGDPATCLPRLVPYKSTTNMESLHEYELKQYR